MSAIVLKDVENAVAKAFAVPPEDLRGIRRLRSISYARMAAMYLSRFYTERSLPQIGRHYGKDHTTVIHALRKVPVLIRENEKFMRQLAYAKAQLESDELRYQDRLQRMTTVLVSDLEARRARIDQAIAAARQSSAQRIAAKTWC